MRNEIAICLNEFTKKVGASLVGLAGKLGLTRQGVTKWDRQGTYPDTNNLICLANLSLVERDPYDYAQ